MVMTMRKFLTRTYDDDNNDDNDGDKRPCFFRQQPTLVGCITGRGVVGDFMMMTKMRMRTMVTTMRRTIALASFRRCYQCSQMAMPTVRTTTTTSFYDMTQQPTSWSDAFLADRGGYDNDNDDKD